MTLHRIHSLLWCERTNGIKMWVNNIPLQRKGPHTLRFYFNDYIVFKALLVSTGSKIEAEPFWLRLTMALLMNPPPWNSMMPKASVGYVLVCLITLHLSFGVSIWTSWWVSSKELAPGGMATCCVVSWPQAHLDRSEGVNCNLKKPVRHTLHKYFHCSTHFWQTKGSLPGCSSSPGVFAVTYRRIV